MSLLHTVIHSLVTQQSTLLIAFITIIVLLIFIILCCVYKWHRSIIALIAILFGIILSLMIFSQYYREQLFKTKAYQFTQIKEIKSHKTNKDLNIYRIETYDENLDDNQIVATTETLHKNDTIQYKRLGHYTKFTKNHIKGNKKEDHHASFNEKFDYKSIHNAVYHIKDLSFADSYQQKPKIQLRLFNKNHDEMLNKDITHMYKLNRDQMTIEFDNHHLQELKQLFLEHNNKIKSYQITIK